MEIKGIFVLVKDSLFSIRFKDEAKHEFSRLFELWRDVEYLESFFEEHKEDLEDDFWQGISVEEAIFKTIEDANRLEQKLLQIAETGKIDRYDTLSSLFKPLSPNSLKIESFEKNKVMGPSHPSWLRIYAIRLDANLFVISGGAIKLTRVMNEREHLLLELQKLDTVKNYLSDEENLDLLPFELF